MFVQVQEDTKNQQTLEYAIVDKSKKTKNRDDKQEKVTTVYIMIEYGNQLASMHCFKYVPTQVYNLYALTLPCHIQAYACNYRYLHIWVL